MFFIFYFHFVKRSPSPLPLKKRTPYSELSQPNAFQFNSIGSLSFGFYFFSLLLAIRVRIPADTILGLLLTFPHSSGSIVFLGVKLHFRFSFPNLELTAHFYFPFFCHAVILCACVFFFSECSYFFFIDRWGCEPKRYFPKMHKHRTNEKGDEKMIYEQRRWRRWWEREKKKSAKSEFLIIL